MIISIEKTNSYKNIDKFFESVYNRLKPGGILALADFRSKKTIEILEKQIKNSKFVKIKYFYSL